MVRRISVQRERLNQIRRLLSKREMQFEELLEQLECGRATLADDLRLLINRSEITHREGLDRRKKFYRATDKAKTERKKYDAVQFIEDLEEPFYYEKPRRIGDYHINIDLFVEFSEEDREKGEMFYRNVGAGMEKMSFLYRNIKNYVDSLNTQTGVEASKFALFISVRKHSKNEAL